MHSASKTKAVCETKYIAIADDKNPSRRARMKQPLQAWNNCNPFHLTKALRAFLKLYGNHISYFYQWSKSLEIFTLGFTLKSFYCYIWLFNVFIVIGLLACTSNIITLLNYKSADLVHLLISLLFLIVSLFNLAFAKSLYQNQATILLAFLRLHKLSTDWLWYSNISSRRTNAKWKIVSFLTIGLIYGILAVCIVFSVLLVIVNLDPFNNLLLNGPFIFTKYVTRFVRILLTFIYLYETGRLYGLLVLLIFFWLEMQTKCLQVCENGNISMENFLRFYRELQITVLSWKAILSGWIQLILSELFLLIVICNVACIRYAEYIPISVYWILPYASTVNTIIVLTLFPFLVESLIRTRCVLNARKLNRKATAHIRMRLQALVPIAVKFGNCFVLTKKTQLEYIVGIVERSMTGILLEF